MAGKKPSYITVDGFKLPVSVDVDAFRKAKIHKALDDDTYIVTYPKCGTTWMMMIVEMIRSSCSAEKFAMADRIPFLEMDGSLQGIQGIKGIPSPRIIKSHFPMDMLPWNDQAKYIFVARNPFDCCVSFYHHTRGFTQHYDFQDGAFDDFFELFINGETDWNDYFDHLNQLWKARTRPNTLFVTFEQLKEDTRHHIQRVAHFLGGEFKQKVDEVDGFLDKVIDMSSVTKMRANDSCFHSGRAEGMPFVRKGIVGDWRNQFSEQQEKRLQAKFREKCGHDEELLNLWTKYEIPN